jgi:hypothetical protein
MQVPGARFQVPVKTGGRCQVSGAGEEQAGNVRQPDFWFLTSSRYLRLVTGEFASLFTDT